MEYRTNNLRCRGFTLMELLVVIGIVALLSTLSIGAYFGSSMAMARGRSQAQIKMVLEQARQRACMTGQRVAVVILPERTDSTVADNLRGKIVQFVVCAELGKLLNYSGRYWDPFGAVVEKIRSANNEFEAIDIESGRTFRVRYSTGSGLTMGSGVENAYEFTKYSGTGVFQKESGDDYVRVWLPVSKPYNLPNGFKFSSQRTVVFNGDGSTLTDTFAVEREGKSSMNFSVTVNADGTVSL